MNRPAWVFGVVLAACAAIPAAAGSGYSKCTRSPDPPDCIARRAVDSGGLTPEETVETVLRHGLVDLVPRKSEKLLRGLYQVIGGREEWMAPSYYRRDSLTKTSLRLTPPETLHACMALVAAARRDADPFANLHYRALARLAQEDPRIPILALGMWNEVVGMSGSYRGEGVSPVGLLPIWNRAVADKEDEAALLEDVAGRLAFLGELTPQAQEFFTWYAERPGLGPDDRVYLATMFTKIFDKPDKAAALLEGLDGLDEFVEGYEIPQLRWSIAVARLARGYDAASAKLVLGSALGIPDHKIRYFDHGGADSDALERGGARAELRQLGASYLARAEELYGSDQLSGKTQATYFLSAASDSYLRAGDVELARALARIGVPLTRQVLDLVAPPLGDLDKDGDPALRVKAARGEGTAPVEALYISGAIDQALQTRYLTNSARYRFAERAGEKKDPQWLLQDEDWPMKFDFATGEAMRSPDLAFKQAVYDALVGSCNKRDVTSCKDGTLGNIAMLAANMGDDSRMRAALAIMTRRVDAGQFKRGQRKVFAAVAIADSWAHCETLRLASNANRRINR